MSLNIDLGAMIGFSANKSRSAAAAVAAELKDRMVICDTKELFINGQRIGLTDQEAESIRTAASGEAMAEKLTRGVVHIDGDISGNGVVEPEMTSPTSVTGIVTTVYAATSLGKMPLYMNIGKYYHELPGHTGIPWNNECLFEKDGGMLYYADLADGSLKKLFEAAEEASASYGLMTHENATNIFRHTQDINTLQGDVSRLQSASSTHGSDIASLKAKTSSNESAISQIDSDVAALEALLKMA